MAASDRQFDEDGRLLPEMRPTPQHPGLGLLAKALQAITAYSESSNSGGAGGGSDLRQVPKTLWKLLGGPGLGRTVERLSFGEPVTNAGKANVPLIPTDTADAAFAVAPLLRPAARLTSKLPTPGPGTLHGGFVVPEAWTTRYKLDLGGKAPEDLPLVRQVAGLDRYRVIPSDSSDLAMRMAGLKSGSNAHVGELAPELRDTPVASLPVSVQPLGPGVRGSFSPQAGIKLSPNFGSAQLKAATLSHEVGHGAQDSAGMLGLGSSPSYYSSPALRTAMDAALAEVARVNPSLAQNTLIPFRNQAVASPHAAYEGESGEIVARLAGALTGLPGKLPPQAVVDSLLRAEKAKALATPTVNLQNDFGVFPVPVELFANGTLKLHRDIMGVGGTITDAQGNLIGRVSNSASGYSQEAKLSRAPRFTFKDPELVVTRGSLGVDPRQNELMAPSWAITRDGLLTRFGDTYVVPNLDRLEPRVSPTTIRNRDFYTPRASAYPKAVTGPKPGEYVTTPLQQRADARLQARFGETFHNKGVLQEGLTASLNPRSATQKFISLTDPAPRFVTRQNSKLDTSDWLRALRELNPRFQSWKMFEEHPQGARLLRPPDSSEHVKAMERLRLSRTAPRDVLKRIQQGEATPADIRKLEQLREVTSNYGEAKTWGPWPLNSDTTRGVLIPDSRDLDLTDPKLRALRRAGVPLIQYDTWDAPAAFQLANELQRGKHFMPVAPLKGAPSASNPSQASLANHDLPPKQALKLFDVLKAEEKTAALSDAELKKLVDLMPTWVTGTKPIVPSFGPAMTTHLVDSSAWLKAGHSPEVVLGPLAGKVEFGHGYFTGKQLASLYKEWLVDPTVLVPHQKTAPHLNEAFTLLTYGTVGK